MDNGARPLTLVNVGDHIGVDGIPHWIGEVLTVAKCRETKAHPEPHYEYLAKGPDRALAWICAYDAHRIHWDQYWVGR